MGLRLSDLDALRRERERETGKQVLKTLAVSAFAFLALGFVLVLGGGLAMMALRWAGALP